MKLQRDKTLWDPAEALYAWVWVLVWVVVWGGGGGCHIDMPPQLLGGMLLRLTGYIHAPDLEQTEALGVEDDHSQLQGGQFPHPGLQLHLGFWTLCVVQQPAQCPHILLRTMLTSASSVSMDSVHSALTDSCWCYKLRTSIRLSQADCVPYSIGQLTQSQDADRHDSSYCCWNLTTQRMWARAPAAIAWDLAFCQGPVSICHFPKGGLATTNAHQHCFRFHVTMNDSPGLSKRQS